MPAAPAAADPHAGHAMPAAAADPHAGHQMSSGPAAGDPHAGHAMPAAPTSSSPDPHAGHQMAPPDAAADPHAGHAMGPTGRGQTGADLPVGNAPPPEVIRDSVADRVFGRDAMSRARSILENEHGGSRVSKVQADLLEWAPDSDRYGWEVEGWYGGDINRFAFKTEGEGEVGGPLERAEVQALYSRAIDPWFNLEAGVRYDIRPDPRRTYAVIGIEGLAPYWFEVGAQAFLSNKGEAHLRLEASYDQRITQRLILQPAVEANIAAQDVPELAIGSGLSDVELGLRLRYEFAREFAPYVGVNWERKIGDTAAFSRARGERASVLSLVTGVRFWF